MLRPLLLAMALLLSSVVSASALTLSFECIKGSSKKCQTGEKQLSVEVLEGAQPDQVSFTFRNVGGIQLYATALFFDDGSGVLGDLLSVFNSPGTNLGAGGSPKKLPGGKKVGFTPDFRATALKGPGKTGMKAGTEVTVNFSLDQGATFAQLLAALEDGDFQIGVRAGTSFINVPESAAVAPPPVPEPGSLALLAAAAALLALRSRKS